MSRLICSLSFESVLYQSVQIISQVTVLTPMVCTGTSVLLSSIIISLSQWRERSTSEAEHNQGSLCLPTCQHDLFQWSEDDHCCKTCGSKTKQGLNQKLGCKEVQCHRNLQDLDEFQPNKRIVSCPKNRHKKTRTLITSYNWLHCLGVWIV